MDEIDLLAPHFDKQERFEMRKRYAPVYPHFATEIREALDFGTDEQWILIGNDSIIIGPRCARVGDHIYQIQGASTGMVLRKMHQKTGIVGRCWVVPFNQH
jgi:hypothetical protein